MRTGTRFSQPLQFRSKKSRAIILRSMPAIPPALACWHLNDREPIGNPVSSSTIPVPPNRFDLKIGTEILVELNDDGVVFADADCPRDLIIHRSVSPRTALWRCWRGLLAMAIAVKTPTISTANDDCGRSMDGFASLQSELKPRRS